MFVCFFSNKCQNFWQAETNDLSGDFDLIFSFYFFFRFSLLARSNKFQNFKNPNTHTERSGDVLNLTRLLTSLDIIIIWSSLIDLNYTRTITMFFSSSEKSMKFFHLKTDHHHYWGGDWTPRKIWRLKSDPDHRKKMSN